MKLHYLAVPLEVKFTDTKAAAGAFSGYASVFNGLDAYNDRIAPGAFTKTLRDARACGRLPKMMLQHGGGLMGSSVDMCPIGKWTSMQEDSKGLACEGQLFALDTERGRFIHEGMKAGVLDGLSIGYEPIGITYGQKAGDPERTLTEIKLHEVSVVTFPADTAATITQCKTLTRHSKPLEQLKTLSDWEMFFREEGMSRKDATAVVSLFKKCLLQSESERQSDVLRAAQGFVAGLLSTITQRKS